MRKLVQDLSLARAKLANIASQTNQRTESGKNPSWKDNKDRKLAKFLLIINKLFLKTGLVKELP